MSLFRPLQENLEMLQGVTVVLENVGGSVIATGELGDIQIDANLGLTLLIGGKPQTHRNPRQERVRTSRETGLTTILFVGNILLRPATEEEISAMQDQKDELLPETPISHGDRMSPSSGQPAAIPTAG